MKCLTCGSAIAAPIRLYASLLCCPQCGFVFADLSVHEPDLIALYQDRYFKGGEYDDYQRDKAMLQANFANRISTLQRFSNGGRLFEIGAAYGFFLELARRHWEVAGIDVANHAVRYARESLGLEVYCGDFLDHAMAPATTDVFCMWDTLEHLAHPDRHIEKIASCLRQGGLLALTTGDIGSPVARLQGERWRLIHPPTHLWYFSRNTLSRLLDRYGFELVHLSHPGNYRSYAALARWSLQPLGAAGQAAHARLARSRWGARGVNLNLFDIMFAIAQRR